MVNIAIRPRLGSPIMMPSEPSKFRTQVAEPLMPILCSIEPTLTLLKSPRLLSALTLTLGTKNSEIPREPAGASGSLASTR